MGLASSENSSSVAGRSLSLRSGLLGFGYRRVFGNGQRMNTDAQFPEAPHMMADQAGSLPLIHHREPSLLIGLTGPQHLIRKHQQGMCDGHNGWRLTFFLGCQPPEFLLHKTVLLAGNSPGRFG